MQHIWQSTSTRAVQFGNREAILAQMTVQWTSSAPTVALVTKQIQLDISNHGHNLAQSLQRKEKPAESLGWEWGQEQKLVI